MVDNARELCSSVRVTEKNPKNVRWSDMIKSVIEEGDIWKEVLRTRDEVVKER